MSPLVVLNLGKGDCRNGLPIVTAQLWLEGSRVPVKFVGGLPPTEELPNLYQRWRVLYEALYGRLSWRRGSASERIEFETEAVTNVSKAEFQRLCDQLQSSLNQWLNSAGFRNIDQQLRTKLAAHEGIRVIIETDDPLLQKLPWHLWRFFDHYGKAEVAVSALEYERAHTSPPKVGNQMRILVILGHSEGIDIQPDGAMLEQLPEAEPLILTEPTRAELDRWLWRESGWDILFFAGHSTSDAADASGRFWINPTEQLSIGHLKNALKAAIARGLRLAIFNSCDGTGLARALADLNLPQLVVMREPIPDAVAQAFLQNFLRIFSGGEDFYPSVRQAREQLQGIEGDFPCASWLPVIYQNPTEVPITWPRAPERSFPADLGKTPGRNRLGGKRQITLRSLLASSFAITLAVMAIRTLGWLEPTELQAYDRLMRARPPEIEAPIDPRLLVVEMTAEDTDKYKYPLKDDILAKVLARLLEEQPRAIGLDLHRNHERPPGRELLIQQFQRSPNLVTICSFEEGNRDIFGHPAEFSDQQAIEQVGFSDLEMDPAGARERPVVRRHMLSYDPSQSSTESHCATPYSLSLHLAIRFLQAEGVQPLEGNTEGNWKFGPVVFERLAARTGGYQHLDGQSNQILLNYRFTPKPAQRTSLQEVLEGKADNLIKDRIVLIGVTDPVGNDLRQTPYGELPGVWIHTHSVSQILSAVLDDRPLIWVLPQWGRLQWGDFLWVWTWGLVGGFIVWRNRNLLLLGAATGAATLALYHICLFSLIQGGWMPLAPSLLTLIGTAVFWAANTPAQVQANWSELMDRLTEPRRPNTKDQRVKSAGGINR
ncbi:MAG: CHASE2 domain-containing protein [Leptolyngbyaceae cyanobacterium MO_188.B28]|nr:CHASE2 domain-containing protein [Leptolyngbyaceae cyanobacterium MO_188.B28]